MIRFILTNGNIFIERAGYTNPYAPMAARCPQPTSGSLAHGG